jgi:hypothetical protein
MQGQSVALVCAILKEADIRFYVSTTGGNDNSWLWRHDAVSIYYFIFIFRRKTK